MLKRTLAALTSAVLATVSLGLTAQSALATSKPTASSVVHHSASVPSPVKPKVVDWSQVDWSQVESGNCLVVKDGYGFKVCDRGDTKGYWNVAFIGDSHMRQYFAPLDIMAHRYHWKVKFISKSACTVANHKLFPKDLGSDSCRDWNAQLENYLAKNKPFDLIVNSNSAFVSQDDPRMAEAFRTTVQSQTQRGTQWLLISDNPKPKPDFEQCIKTAGAKASESCQIPYSEAMVPADILPTAIAKQPNTHIADFRTAFCPKQCPAVINGVTVYRDFSHISSNFAKVLLPNVDAAVPELFKHKPNAWYTGKMGGSVPRLTVQNLLP